MPLRPLPSAAIAVLLAAAPAVAQTTVIPPPEVERFDRFIDEAGPICATAPSAACVDAAWAFGDADRSGRLEPAEARSLRDALLGWAEWDGNSAAERERAMIFLGLSMVETVGLDRLIGSYDANGDGALSREELLADVHLDERPLGEVLGDPQAVDRAALGRRFGVLAPMLKTLFEGGYR